LSIEQEQKHVMALDLLPAGGDETGEDFGRNERVTKHLPPEVSSKMLYRDIFHIAWPSFIEFVLTQLASMADMMMVGGLGSWAIAAVGLTVQPKFLLMTMFMAMNVGATALVARAKGEGNQQKANRILRQALLLTFVLSSIASVAGYVFAEPLVRFMGATQETLEAATTYLKIQMVGFVGLAITSTLTATLRGVGNTRIAMIYNLIANVVNVVFNYLLIEGNLGFPRWEVAGASIATVIGQCAALIMALIVVLRKGQYLHLSFKDSFKPHWETMKSIFRIGLPAMGEQLVMRAGMIIYAKTVASLGTVAYAIHNICMNIQALSFMNGNAFAVSATSLVGQSLGKKRPDMAQAYSSRTRRLGMSVSILLALIFFFFGKNIVGLYSEEVEVITQGAYILMFVALVQPLQSSQFILGGALRGAGDTRATAVISLITVLLVRPGLALLLIKVFDLGLYGAWIALVCDQALRSVLVLARFNSGKWKRAIR
jgi:putative MATE family efflux protein